MSRAPKPPAVYFSFRSPFSWLALERLREVVPDAMERMNFVPYWDPDPQTDRALRARGAELPYQQMSKAKHLYILHDTKRLTARAGRQMAWPIDVDPWWELPHLAWLRAAELGAGERFYRELVAARWESGRDICTREVIAELAARAGLEAAELAAAPEDAGLRARGVDGLVAAYEDDIFGIPYFRIGRHRFWGLDRLEDFLREWSSRPAPPVSSVPDVPTPLLTAVGDYDRDTAGGCG
jgi:2-hydroxychromene-2-carboxylate isomerase